MHKKRIKVSSKRVCKHKERMQNNSRARRGAGSRDGRQRSHRSLDHVLAGSHHRGDDLQRRRNDRGGERHGLQKEGKGLADAKDV